MPRRSAPSPTFQTCAHEAWEAALDGTPQRCADCQHVFTPEERATRAPARTLRRESRRPPRTADGKIRVRDEAERKRVVEIATSIVASRVARGEIDPEDDTELRGAMKEAVDDAVVAYRAAVEYLSG